MKNIIAYSFILFFAGISLVSCLGDLDTMPLDDNQLVSEKVYQTKDATPVFWQSVMHHWF